MRVGKVEERERGRSERKREIDGGKVIQREGLIKREM